MTSQLELSPFRAAPQDPNVDWLVAELDRQVGWVTATTLRTISGERLDDRSIRVLAAAACPRVISGQRGYRSTTHASADEVAHFVTWMESQAREMTRRAEAVRRYCHARLG